MIRIKNLSKTINGKKILDSLTVNLNGVTGIIGPNGAGKSTLMKIIACLDLPDKGGYIEFEKINNRKIKIGYLPQDFSIYPNLTLLEALKLLAALKGNLDINHINYLLKTLNLSGYEKEKMKNLSGGYKRRVGIAQALLDKPNYIIIDEPTAGLDMHECINLRNVLMQIGKEVNIIITSHNPEDIEHICDQVLVINKGKISFEGELSEMIELTRNLTYETITEATNIESLKEVGEIVKVDKISNTLAKVTLVTTKTILNKNLFKSIDPLFSGSYVMLLKGDNVI